jgi:hypothetical protein
MADTHKPEDDLNDRVGRLHTQLGLFMAINEVPPNIGMAAIAMLLAVASHKSGFSRHKAITQFISVVNDIYEQLNAESNDG